MRWNEQQQPFLPYEESHHCIRVCRIEPHHTFEVTDGAGKAYIAQWIPPFSKKGVLLRLVKSLAVEPPPKTWVLFPILHERERLRFLIEKSVELGAGVLVPVQFHYGQIKRFRLERWEKVAQQAIKQSRRSWLPKWYDAMSLEKALRLPLPKQRFFGSLQGKPWHPCEGACAFTVGPEGGFHEKEETLLLQNGFVPISLGGVRYRSETALLALLSLCHCL